MPSSRHTSLSLTQLALVVLCILTASLKVGGLTIKQPIGVTENVKLCSYSRSRSGSHWCIHQEISDRTTSLPAFCKVHQSVELLKESLKQRSAQLLNHRICQHWKCLNCSISLHRTKGIFTSKCICCHLKNYLL